MVVGLGDEDRRLVERAGEVPLVAGVHPAGRHRGVDHLLEGHRGAPLLIPEGGHHLQAQVDAVGGDGGEPRVRSSIDLVHPAPAAA